MTPPRSKLMILVDVLALIRNILIILGAAIVNVVRLLKQNVEDVEMFTRKLKGALNSCSEFLIKRTLSMQSSTVR